MVGSSSGATPGLLRLVGLLVLIFCAEGQPSVSLPDGFLTDVVLGGLRQPVDFCYLPLGPAGEERYIVVEKDGLVKLVINGEVQGTDFMDIRAKTNDYGDRGLLSCAVDTSFTSNRFVYFAYVYEDGSAVDGPKTGQVIRLTVNAEETAVLPASEVVLLGSRLAAGCDGIGREEDVLCCDSTSHSVGALEMDASGALWVTNGDGASFSYVDERALECLDPDSLRGKLLRIDRNGRGFSDNPFVSRWTSLDRNAAKVWTVGARNSFRLHLDPILGLPWTCEVGWNNYEEVNLGRRGGNWEWPCRQGPEINAGYANYRTCRNFEYGYYEGRLSPPVVAWDHSIGSAASGALRVSVPNWPSQYRDNIYYTDYTGNWMKRVQVNSAGDAVGRSVDFLTNLPEPVQTRVAPDGNSIWIALIREGQILRVSYNGGNSSPLRVVAFSPRTDAMNVEVDTDVAIEFNKAIDATDLEAKFAVREVGETADIAGDWTYDSIAYTVRFTPEADFAFSTTFVVSLRDVEADIEGDIEDQISTFTTVAEEAPPPTVISVIPTDGSGDVDIVAPTIRITFSKPMDINSLIADVRIQAGTGSINVGWSPSFNRDSTVLDLDVEQLAFSTTYVVSVGTTAVDLVGLTLEDAFTFSFTTEASPPPAGDSIVYVDTLEVIQERWRRGEYTLTSNPLTLTSPNGDRSYARGLLITPSKKLTFALPSGCARLVADVGLTPEAGPAATLDYAVISPTRRACRSGLMVFGDAPRTMDCDVSGQDTFSLVSRDRRDGNDDDRGAWGEVQLVCPSSGGGGPPRCNIDATSGAFLVGDEITFTAQAFDGQDQELDASALTWTVLLHHCGPICHVHQLFAVSGVAGDSFTVPNHGDFFFFEVQCTACVADGECGTSSVSVYPETALLTVDSEPSGLTLGLDTKSGEGPLQQVVVVGSEVSLSAVANQADFRFDAWDFDPSAGATTRVTITSSAPQTFIATFTPIL